MSTIRFQLHSIQFKKKNTFETYFPYYTIFSLIIGFHLGRHLGYIEMLNDARVASLGFFKYNVCSTRINKEKKFKIKFQVPLKFAQILPDVYYNWVHTCPHAEPDKTISHIIVHIIFHHKMVTLSRFRMRQIP